MLYVSIDIETSGLNPDMNNVLSIGAIIEDTTKKLPYEELPKFNAIVIQNNIQGSPRAITMNSNIISMMGEYLEGKDEVRELLNNNSGYKFYTEDEVVKEFYYFLINNGYGDGFILVINGQTKPITINVAGKNFGTFDKLFLEELPWWKKLIRTRSRIIDPSILFVDWSNDEAIPSLTKCKERANIEGIVTHNALEDAWDVIELLRKNY
jgi:oligoribonuclease